MITVDIDLLRLEINEGGKEAVNACSHFGNAQTEEVVASFNAQ